MPSPGTQQRGAQQRGAQQRGARSAALKCPCGSGGRYRECCEPFHRGEAQTDTAEQVMRARYSAYAKNVTAYVLDSWHPDTRPEEIGEGPRPLWVKLKVVDAIDGLPGDDLGTVEFEATYRLGEPAEELTLHEIANFERIDGRWFYLDSADGSRGVTKSG